MAGEAMHELLAFPHGRHDDQVDSFSLYFGGVREKACRRCGSAAGAVRYGRKR